MKVYNKLSTVFCISLSKTIQVNNKLSSLKLGEVYIYNAIDYYILKF